MLLVTHDMGVVARLADDVAVMSQGKIVEQGDVETLFNAPKHTVTRSLFPLISPSTVWSWHHDLT